MKEKTTLKDKHEPQLIDPDYGRVFVFCHLSDSHGTIDERQYKALEALVD